MSTPAVKGPFLEQVFSHASVSKHAKNGVLRYRVSQNPAELSDMSVLAQVVHNGHYIYVPLRAEIKTALGLKTWPKIGDWANPWGLRPTDEPPADMFQDCVALEDYLQHNGVFRHGMRDTSAHMDSYMTIVCPERLDKSTQLLIDTYKPAAEDWQRILDHWTTNPNTCPPARIVAVVWAGRFKLTLKTYDPKACK